MYKLNYFASRSFVVFSVSQVIALIILLGSDPSGFDACEPVTRSPSLLVFQYGVVAAAMIIPVAHDVALKRLKPSEYQLRNTVATAILVVVAGLFFLNLLFPSGTCIEP